MDFGTAAVSREVQRAMVKRLQQESWFVGTSNYDLARRTALTPMGTQAHRWFRGASTNQSDHSDQSACRVGHWLNEYRTSLVSH